jgi:tetratricopeptide (TPR) repeat protein
LAEVLSGHRLDRAGGLVPLEPAELQAAWDELRAKDPAELGPTPRPQVLAWHNGQAHDAARRGSWYAAAVHLDPLVAAAPKDPLLRLRRARAALRLGRWDRAAEDAARALSLGSRHESAWETLALARLHQGDAARYRQLCATLRERFGSTEDAKTARVVARICVLGPGGVADGEGEWLVRLARLGARDAKRSSTAPAHLPGAALYRAGAWREAVRELETAGKEGPEDQLFLAMAHHRLGEADRARQRLDKVTAFVERVLKVVPEGSGSRPALPATTAQYAGKRSLTVAREATGGLPFERQLGLALLLNEARALIGEAK